MHTTIITEIIEVNYKVNTTLAIKASRNAFK